MALSDLLDKTCDLLIQAEDADGVVPQDLRGGADREPHTLVQADVPCMVREMGGGNDPRNGKATGTKIHRVYFEPEDLDVEVTSEYLIRVNFPRYADRLLVVVDTVDSNSLGRLLAVDCTEQPV